MADPALRQDHIARTESRLRKGMQRALARASSEAVGYLLRQGASPTARLSDGETALALSAQLYAAAPTAESFRIRSMVHAVHCATLHRFLDMPPSQEQVTCIASWLDEGGIPLYTHTDGLYPLERVRARLSDVEHSGEVAARRAEQAAHLQAVETLLEDAAHKLLRGASRAETEGEIQIRILMSGITLAAEGTRSWAAYYTDPALSPPDDRALMAPPAERQLTGKYISYRASVPTPQGRFDDVKLLLYGNRTTSATSPAI